MDTLWLIHPGGMGNYRRGAMGGGWCCRSGDLIGNLPQDGPSRNSDEYPSSWHAWLVSGTTISWQRAIPAQNAGASRTLAMAYTLGIHLGKFFLDNSTLDPNVGDPMKVLESNRPKAIEIAVVGNWQGTTSISINKSAEAAIKVPAGVKEAVEDILHWQKSETDRITEAKPRHQLHCSQNK